jgi:SNF2 family DNA or RNA helicase
VFVNEQTAMAETHNLPPLWKDFQFQQHQVEGIRWLLEKEADFPNGGLLCDEMGLGKTIQMLALILFEPQPSTLLLAPLATLSQWQQTAEKCGINVWCAEASGWYQTNLPNASAPHLYILNYDKALSRPHFVLRAWSRLICDEAHILRTPTTQLYQIVESIDAERKWFLTATPIVNKVENATALFRLLGYMKAGTTIPALEPLIKELVLCRKMSDLRPILPSLPLPPIEMSHSLDFATEEEEDFYRGVQGHIQRQWKALEEDSRSATDKFRLIMRLRQISVHPQVYISARKKNTPMYSRGDWSGSSTKFLHVRKLIEEGASTPHRWILFCNFLHEIELLEAFLMESPVVREIGLYHGGMSLAKKEEAVEQSKEPLRGFQQDVLLVQLQSGGVGLNLQHCDRIVFLGPWWTSATMEQAIGRAVRIGQTKQVQVHHLILKEEETLNIDKMMMERVEEKRSLASDFLRFAEGQQKPASM